jgi:hypothetical protein
VETPQYAAEVSLGRTVQGMSDDLYRIEDQQDTRRAEDGLNDLLRSKLELTIGEQEGFTNIKGKDAVSRPLMKEYGEKFDDAQKRVAEGLTNTRQKERFGRRAEIARLQYDQDLIRHITQQQDVDAKEVLDGTLDVETQAASLRSNDPSAIALSRKRIAEAVDAYAQHSDWGKEKTASFRLAALSQMHAAVLGQMMATNDDRGARVYFQANRNEIEPKVAEHVQGALEQSGVRGESQRAFDKIIATKPEKDWIGEARAIDDPEVRDQVETRVRQERALREVERKDTEDKRFLSATNTVDQTGSYLKIPPTDWQQMSLQERAALKRYADDKRAGTQPTTNWGVLTRFTEMKPEDQAKLTQADLMREYRPRLDDGAYSHVLSRWQQARDAMEKPEAQQKLSSTLQFDDQTLYTFRSVGGAGWDTPIAKFTPDQSRQYGMFRTEAAVIVESEERATGKEVAATRRQQILDQLVLRYTIARTERGWPDPHKLVIDMSMEERKAGYVELKNMIPANKGHLLSLARRIGAIPIEMTNAQAEKRFADRLQRAYFQAAEGASEEELAATLRGPR